MMLAVGVIMLLVGGGLLSEVPFKKFLPAIILIVAGSEFFILGAKSLL